MAFDYFYGPQADQFSFYRVPKMLFTEERFWNVSTDAKMLYGILLDRMNLSAKNQWFDEQGRVYIIFTIEEIQNSLGCADKKATKLLDELEKKCGLIERKRQGLGKPNLIYVKNFVSSDTVERRFLNRQNHDSGTVESTIQEKSKSRCNYTDINDTEFSDTDPFLSSENYGLADGKHLDYSVYHRYFYEQLNMEYLRKEYPYDIDLLDNILDLIVETVCSNRKTIRIASDDKPSEVVKSRFMKLESEHIRFVLKCFKETTTKIYNIKQYLLASIYNAPLTIEGYYDALVRHDMAQGLIGGGDKN